MMILRVVITAFILTVASLTVSADATVRQIVGANVDRGIIPPPSGLCSGARTFNMIQEGLMVMTEATTFEYFGVGPLEDSFDGNGYFLLNNAANVNTLYKITLPSFTVTSTTVTDTANAPDNTNTQSASHYNPFTSSWVQIGDQSTAPCNAAVNDCIHVRTYPGGTLLVDTRPGFGQLVNGATLSTVDATDTYYTYTQTSGGAGVAGVYLGRLFTSTYTVISVVRTSAATQYAGITNDANFIYAVLSTGDIHRFLKTNLAGGPTVFTPGLSGGNSSDIAYNMSTDELFVTVRSAGITDNLLYKINAATMTITGTGVMGITQFAIQAMPDPMNNKVYVGTAPGGTAGGLARFNMSTLALEQSFSTVSTANGPSTDIRIDIPHQKAYIPFLGGGGSQSQLQKVSLCN